MRTKVTVAFETIWDVRNSSGEPDVYGTPVHVSSRMERHAVANTIVIDERDKEPVAEWFDPPEFRIDALRKKLKDYPDRKLYLLSV